MVRLTSDLPGLNVRGYTISPNELREQRRGSHADSEAVPFVQSCCALKNEWTNLRLFFVLTQLLSR